MIVKICGITRPGDAEAAVNAGASALGFIFWPESPRFVDPFRAKAIARQVPAFVTLVGVFVNQPASYINAVSSLVGLGAVQLHGDETADALPSLRRPVIKALSGAAVTRGDGWPATVTLLVDAHDPVKRGGTGEVADWSAAAALASKRRVVLAGGLRPENVAGAVAAVKPFGIDVSSGVEVAPGIKSPERIAALFMALKTS